MELLEKLMGMSNEEEAKERGKVTIFRVPSHIKETNPAAYTPHLFSIGPYHHGRPELQAAEKLKHRTLSHWLKRHSLSFGDLIASLKLVVQLLMDCYEGLGEEWKDEERFLQLMALDGCFLLELFPKFLPEGRAYRESDYPENGPVIGTRTVLSDTRSLRNDVFMIENQLPGMVLDTLQELEASSLVLEETGLHLLDMYRKNFIGLHCESSLSPQQQKYPNFFPASALKLAGIENQLPHMAVCRLFMLGEEHSASATAEESPLHILDAYGKSLIGLHCESSLSPNQQKYPNFFSASTLKQAGVVFKRKTTDARGEIEFDKDTGTLALPDMPLDAHFEPQLLNAVAFERLCPAVGHGVSAYINFLDGLIQSVNDVQVLRSQKIIQTGLSDDQKIVEFLRKLCYDVNYYPESCYEKEREAMRDYFVHNRKQWRRRFRGWRLNIQETYFKSPWSIIALVAGTLLLGLTMARTIYAAKG